MKKSLFIPILAMLFVAAACTSPDDLADSGNDGKQEKAIKVGDYYNQGLVKGIVFNVDETGQHGMVVSLDEKSLQWSTLESSVIAGAVYVSLDYGLDNVLESKICSKIGQRPSLLLPGALQKIPAASTPGICLLQMN